VKLRRLLGESLACLQSLRWHKPHRLAVLALFKNEAHVLAEWVQHYAAEGATAIHLVNNNSSDDYLTVLQPFIESGLVVLHNDSRLYAQREIYNDQLQMLRPLCQWLLICDLDEFIYARVGHRRCIDVLDGLPAWVSSVQIPWKMFGSSGHYEQPSQGVRAGFRHRVDADDQIQPHPCMPLPNRIASKTIARSSRIRSLDVHSANLLYGQRILPDGNPALKGSFQPISEALLRRSLLHLNHYAIQSEQVFRQVKMSRGDVNHADYVAIRDMAYFHRYDRNERVDEELAQRCSS